MAREVEFIVLMLMLMRSIYEKKSEVIIISQKHYHHRTRYYDTMLYDTMLYITCALHCHNIPRRTYAIVDRNVGVVEGIAALRSP